MKTRKSVFLLSALLSLAILVLPLQTALASVSAPGSAQAAPSSLAGQDAARFAMPTDQIIIKYKTSAIPESAISPASATQLQRLSDAAGVSLAYVREMSGDAHVLRLPARTPLKDVQAIADRLSALPEVEYAEPDAIMVPMLTPNDPQYANQWHYFAPGAGHYGINAPAAWNITTGSASIVVADLDTGITSHAEFVGRTVPGYDFVSDSLVANDGNGRDSDPSDPGDWITAAESVSGYFAGCTVTNSSWHGTHTAGTIGAASNNGAGVAGINWVSKILPVRILGKCGGYVSDEIDGMRWSAGLTVPEVPANANPAKVLNLSLGGSGSCGAAEQDAINAVTAAGATVVVSAGNDNANASGFRPASCNGVITVAATDRDGSRAYYSNYGSVVEISAPGGDTHVATNGILSTLNTGTQGPVADTYDYYQGTSMAAPHVSGVVSLLYSLNPALTPAQVLSILQSTVTAFPGGSTCNTSVCGSGIVNAGAAVAAVGNPVPAITGLNPFSATPGGPAFTLPVDGTGFISSSVVRWKGTDRTTTYVSSTRLTAQITAADIATAGTANVTVFNPAPGGGTSNAMSFVVGTLKKVYLPAILKGYPPVPVLNPISNADGDGNYTVSWNSVPTATAYTLEEDDNASFASPETRYSGAGTSWNAVGKPDGTYYYRVNASGSWGTGPWSGTQSTTVGLTGPQPGFWQNSGGSQEFYVTSDRQYVDDYAVRVSVSGCGTYKITHVVPVPISSNSFSFSGTFYAFGTFTSATTANVTSGLDDFYISGCGYVTGGPWSTSASWKNAVPAAIEPAGGADTNSAEPTTSTPGMEAIRVK